MPKAKTQKRQRMIACRFCRAESKTDRNSRSNFMHSHPAVCPHRQDRVPIMNGVHVGDLWKNMHTGSVFRIVELRLGGAGTYTDREPCAVTVSVWSPPAERLEPEGDQLSLEIPADPMPPLEELVVVEPEERAWVHTEPLWGLVEHSDPLSRPGEYPVPFVEREGLRWAEESFRGPGYRRADDVEEKDRAYFHSRFVVDGYAISWHGDEWIVDLP